MNGQGAGEYAFPEGGVDRGRPLPVLLREYERQLIARALMASDGCQRRAAAALGVLPTTLNMKLKRLGLRRVDRGGVLPDPV